VRGVEQGEGRGVGEVVTHSIRRTENEMQDCKSSGFLLCSMHTLLDCL
jgi:hypothetical protein